MYTRLDKNEEVEYPQPTMRDKNYRMVMGYDTRVETDADFRTSEGWTEVADPQTTI